MIAREHSSLLYTPCAFFTLRFQICDKKRHMRCIYVIVRNLDSLKILICHGALCDSHNSEKRLHLYISALSDMPGTGAHNSKFGDGKSGSDSLFSL